MTRVTWWALASCAGAVGCELAAGIHERSVQSNGAATSAATGAGGSGTSTSTSTGAGGIEFVLPFTKRGSGKDKAFDGKLPDLEAGDVVLIVLDVNDDAGNVVASKPLEELSHDVHTDNATFWISDIWYVHTATSKEVATPIQFTTMNQDTAFEYTGVVYRGAKPPISATVKKYLNPPYQPLPSAVTADHSVVVLSFTRWIDNDAVVEWTMPADWTKRFDDGGIAFFDKRADKGTLMLPAGTTPPQMSGRAMSGVIVLEPK